MPSMLGVRGLAGALWEGRTTGRRDAKVVVSGLVVEMGDVRMVREHGLERARLDGDKGL